MLPLDSGAVVQCIRWVDHDGEHMISVARVDEPDG
jgi:hypothetical protein